MNNNEQSVSIDHLNTHLPSNLPLAYSSTYQHVKRCTLQSRLGKNIKKINKLRSWLKEEWLRCPLPMREFYIEEDGGDLVTW